MNQKSATQENESTNVLTVKLTFRVADKEHSYSHDIVLPHAPTEDGIAIAATETFAEIEKEIHFSDFYEQLADPGPLMNHLRRSYKPEEFKGKEHSFHLNTQHVWQEITNTLLSAKYSLAQARAYKDVELLMIKEGADTSNPQLLNVHFDKMSAFDAAVYRLAKIEDLFLLLLFVNLGNSLVETNLESDDWQKRITWNAVKDGLRRRHPEVVSNRYLNELPDEDYATIRSVFQKYKNPQVMQITAYRDATTHRIPPSVDYSGLTGVLLFPKFPESGGSALVGSFVRRFTIDHQFLDLYEMARKAFSHLVQVLKQLKEVPRFA